jgi:hypothetical protein
VIFNGERIPLHQLLQIPDMTLDALTGVMSGYTNSDRTGPGSYWERRVDTARGIVSGQVELRHYGD